MLNQLKYPYNFSYIIAEHTVHLCADDTANPRGILRFIPLYRGTYSEAQAGELHERL